MTRRKADEEENCGEAEGRPGSTTGPVCSVPSQRLRCHRTRQKNDAKKKREERKRTKNVLDELSAVSARELGVELGGHHVAPLKRGDELDLFRQ